jgi:uncharacterized protein YdeI (YjbR/CyaY-like superfamily)
VEATFFASPAEFRAWLEENHDKESEIVVGYYKVATGRPSMTWAESVDEALCFGWIDGIRRSLGDEAYTNRFTPRKARSNWSQINIRRVRELTKQGRMHPAGIRAFEARKKADSAYSYETTRTLDEPWASRLKANKAAWKFFDAQPPSYKRVASWYVMSAKRDETREKRLREVIECSVRGERLPQMARYTGKNRTSS